ncbi:MAG: hypothetical protein AAGE89_03040 [Pseudomonadota bacterium]
MRTPLFTKSFFASLFGSLIGLIIACGPLFWSAMALDINSNKNETTQPVELFFGVATFAYSSLVMLVNETLICGIALGITSAIAWFESWIDDRPLGFFAGLFAAMSIIGSLLALFLFIGILQSDVQSILANDTSIKYIQSAYIIFITLVFSYFASILQVRRIKDLGSVHG